MKRFLTYPNRLSTNAPRYVVGVLVISIVAATIWYFVKHFKSPTFVESTMGNLFATLIGVIVGIPIALYINRAQLETEEAASHAKQATEHKKRKETILSLLRAELQQNLQDLHERRKEIQAGGKREVFVDPLRAEVWLALSDGGEIKWIDDLELLAHLAAAYHQIKNTIFLERKFLETLHFPGMKIKVDKYPHDHLLDYIVATDTRILGAIETAVHAINQHVPLLTPRIINHDTAA